MKSTRTSESKKYNLIPGGAFILSFLFLFLSLYSYGRLSSTELETYSVEIVNIEQSHSYRKAWMTFQTTSNETLYCRTDDLPEETRDTLDELKKTAVFPIDATISYTRRKDLLPVNYIFFNNYSRLVSIEVAGNTYVGLEQYNSANTQYRVGFIVVSVIVLLVGVLMLILNLSCRQFKRNTKKRIAKKERR